MTRQRYVMGIDVGQANDPTAVAIIEHDYHDRNPTYRVRALHRYRLGTRYPAIVHDITTRLLAPPLARTSMLAIDATGVGRPVVDLFRDTPGIRDVYGITITAGTAVAGSGYQLSVPKRDLITTTAVLLQHERVRIAPDLPDTHILVGELLSYRIKTTDSGHQRYEPASTREHDDLLLATSLALWLAEHRPPIHASFHVTTARIPTPEERFLPNWF
jgi:hypothetical protein